MRLIAAAMLVVGGCSSSALPGPGGGTYDAAPGRAETIELFGAVFGCVVPSLVDPNTRLPETTVCELRDQSNCTMTDMFGSFSLRLPKYAETGITIQRPGYTNTLIPIATKDRDMGLTQPICVADLSITKRAYSVVGVEHPDNRTGFLVAFVLFAQAHMGTSAVQFQLLPHPATGPIYLDSQGSPDAGLKATSSRGVAIAAYSAGIEEVTLTYLPMTLSCETLVVGWRSGRANSVRIPMLPGFEVQVGAYCR